MNLQGIDVSAHQGKINWEKVGKTGVKFVMARASYGKKSRDKTFEANVAGAQKNGLDVGAYHFCYAENVAEAQAEAKNFLNAVKGHELTYPLVFDLENNSSTDKAIKKWSDMAVVFLRELEYAGYFAMLYSGKYALETYFDAKKIAPFAVWVAQWTNKCTYKGSYGIWQYSDKGRVSGINGAVDMDISYVDYAKIIKRAKLNHL